jgi:hypothetical protein
MSTLSHQPYRPEAEGAWALPHGEYGLDVIALVGMLRYRHHHSLAEIHHRLHERGLSIGERTVLNLLARYEELVALHLTDRERLQALVRKQGYLILAVDGLRPDVGHEVLWVVRDCVSSEILLARPLLSERETDLTALRKRSTRGPLGSYSWGDFGWAAFDSQGGRLCFAGSSPSTLPLSLPARSG